VELGRGGRPDAPQLLDAQRVQEVGLLLGGHDEQAVGLGCPPGHLGEDLRARDPDRDRQPDALAHVAADPLGDLARGRVDLAHVEERLLEPQRLDGRGGGAQHVEDRAAGLGVGAEVRADDDRMGTAPPRLAAAHPAADAVRARLVAGGHDHPTADDDRAPAQGRVVTLLDRREERVDVGMEDVRDRVHANSCSHPVRTRTSWAPSTR
jgi:hypothetical protein